ncbi:alpha/beta hydrolase [Flavobacterium luteum]|uniref:Alpha/beta hydrolase n=1 Tax=Flavobacterium luteum TaxID=2026654 RepID=A0A7J5AH78_9FLAO|nr:alpha/beta hydrolase-fold protein [Flavobacterium luteum]KAB1156906.1 alpha/beta hydrolase [Flavobacterium luteum]
MRKLFLLLLTIYSACNFGQVTKIMYPSLKLNGEREITIGLPKSYEQNPNKKYPLIIILDGDYLFDPFLGALRYGAYWDDLPETITVGISQNKNNERESDSTYGENTGLPIDQGSAFFEFIGLELIPYIQEKYRIAPFKIIAGHDTTAGFLNFYLYKDVPLFDGYISMSPILAKGMIQEIPKRLSVIEKPIFYYLSTADGDIKKMQTSIKELDSVVGSVSNSKLDYKFNNFKGENHYSMVSISIPKALSSFFAKYSPISIKEFLEVIVKLPNGHVDYLVNKYEIIKKTLSINMPIRINDYRAIEAAILKNKTYDEFKDLSDLAKRDYPKSMLSDFYLALMYEKKGDFKKASKTYQGAYLKEEIRDLTTQIMLDKADELKNQ